MKWATKLSDKQTLGEEIANSISHGLMVLFGIFVSCFFCKKVSKSNNPYFYIVLIFSISMILLYLMSTLYHALAFTNAKKIFKKTDHISIYLLIWGTFTPILLLLPKLQTPLFQYDCISKGTFFFVCQCILVSLGIIGKIFWINKGKYLHLVFYALLGWSGLILVPQLVSPPHSKKLFQFILLGGFFYSLGIFFYVKDNKKYFHFIWHIFVMLGTLLHTIAIYYLL